jgi:hypothetical protein
MTEAIGAVRRQIAAPPEDWHGADAMWDLAEVVGNAAFFVRTPASALDPFGEGWWQQRINRRFVHGHLPPRQRVVATAKDALPERLRTALQARLGR